MAPQNGMDRRGPTALINSMNSIDYTLIANGINFNLKLDAKSVQDEKGRNFMNALLDVYFSDLSPELQDEIIARTSNAAF